MCLSTYSQAFSQPVCLSYNLIDICLWQDIECHFHLLLIADKSAAVELILNSHQRPVRQTEIHRAPLAHASKLRNTIDPHELVAKDIRLILLGPAILFASVHHRFPDSAQFTGDRRLLIVNAPIGDFRWLRVSLMSADIIGVILCTT
jgi:hypothetical protein